MATNAHFNWFPSTARVVAVDGFGPSPRGSLQLAPSLLIWPSKDPADILDFVVEYSEALAGNSGDAIATLDVSILPNGPGDLAITTSMADGTQAVLWLSGGQAGTTYAVTVVVGTNGGRSIARTISLPVATFALAGALGNDLIAKDGVAITDQTGAPLTVHVG